MVLSFCASKVLRKKCKNLAYSKSGSLDNATFTATKNEIQELYAKYGIAVVLGELSQLWGIEKAVPFFDKIYSKTKTIRKLKTIATFYRRAYNGGVERVNALLINLWLEMGYKVVLITEEKPHEMDYFYPRNKVKRITIPSCSKINLPNRLCALQKVLTEESVDVFINHGWMNSSVLWECVLMKNMKIPYVLYVHGYFPSFYKNIRYAFYYQIFRMADLVIAISETNAKFYQMCGCKTCLVQNPISEELKNINQTAALNSHRVLWIGRIAEEKHPLDAVFILKKVREQVSDVELDVVGESEGDCFKKMRLLSKELGVFDAIRFHGLQSENKMKDFYINSALLLVTSESESYSMILLESKAFGVPCVMYNLPYLSLVKDGKGFLSSEFGNIDTMANNIIQLLKYETSRKLLGQEARESFNTFTNYDLRVNWQKIFDFCEGKESEEEMFYVPDKLANTDKYIFPSLFDVLQQTVFKNFVKKSFDYKLERLKQKIPRKMLILLKRIGDTFK